MTDGLNSKQVKVFYSDVRYSVPNCSLFVTQVHKAREKVREKVGVIKANYLWNLIMYAIVP